MITLRPSSARGHFNHGWLDTYHTFAFAEYFDPAHVQFRSLRVINEDRIAPATGFPTHPHRDMEIITYVLEGALAHRDSMGNGSTILPGDVQRMSAGTGITHSEYSDRTRPTHLLQIWILPDTKGLTPSYEQKQFDAPGKLNRLRLIASRDGREGAVTIHQDADVYATLLEPGQGVTHALATGRAAWVQVAAGAATLNGESLRQGDGASVTAEDSLVLTNAGDEQAEVLLFDLV